MVIAETAINEDERETVTDVGALIVRDDGRIFVQRRSPSRRLFPGAWDIVGGTVETAETPLQALCRETTEETGWSIVDVLHEYPAREWSEGARVHREKHFIVRVSGDPDRPILEDDKHDAHMWAGKNDLSLLEASAERTGSDLILRVVQDALSWLESTYGK